VEETEENLKKIGARIASSRQSLGAAWEDAQRAAAEAKISQRRIAELLGVDRMTVRKWIRAHDDSS
jgi:transcriptional regulator with XRE-family HTH domain